MLIGARAAIVKSAPSADHIAGSSMKPLTLLAGPLLAFCACCAADGQMLEFGGFGTLGVAHSNNQQADYRADKPFAARGPGRSRQTGMPAWTASWACSWMASLANNGRPCCSWYRNARATPVGNLLVAHGIHRIGPPAQRGGIGTGHDRPGTTTARPHRLCRPQRGGRAGENPVVAAMTTALPCSPTRCRTQATASD